MQPQPGNAKIVLDTNLDNRQAPHGNREHYFEQVQKQSIGGVQERVDYDQQGSIGDQCAECQCAHVSPKKFEVPVKDVQVGRTQ